MTRLILVRHGNTFESGQTPVQVGARTDLPLTAHGRVQAEEMAKHLVNECITPKAIFSGKLKRQLESANIIAGYFGLDVQDASALMEIDYGLWEGLTAKEIAAKWPKEYEEWTDQATWQNAIFQGTEAGHRQNLENWVKSLRNTYQGEAVVAITSNGLLRFLKNEKVKTGHFCELQVLENAIRICSWNQTTS